jgi:phospholipase/lecithinase/hemolysin
MNIRRFTCLLGSLLAAFHLSSASAGGFTELVAFSGALTDTGNAASEGAKYPPPFYKNRNSNGPLAIDVFAARLGLKSDPSLHLIGKSAGTNYAVSDALAGANGPHDLPAQISAYLASKKGKADPNALYFVFIGGNDVVLAALNQDDRQSEVLLDKAVEGIAVGIRRLVGAGAKTIFAPDFIDLGYAPALHKAGTNERASRLSNLYNQRFDKMLDTLQAEMNFELVRWKFSDFVNDLMAHANEFGFDNVSDSCQDFVKAGRCNTERFVFLNDVYPTAKVHELVGNALALRILQRPAAASTKTASNNGR